MYQLIQKHLLICCTILHYIDFCRPLMSSSHTDIWYLVSNNPEICQKSWKMTYRKKGKIFRDGSNCPIIWWINSKKIIIWYKRVLSKGDKGLIWINWWKLTVTVCFESNFMWKSNVLEIYASENVSLWANPKNLSFFLYVILKLFWHIVGLFDTKYQMSICDNDIKGPSKSI